MAHVRCLFDFMNEIGSVLKHHKGNGMVAIITRLCARNLTTKNPVM